MGSSSWFVFFKAMFLETLHQNQLFEGTPLGLQSLSKILIHLCAYTCVPFPNVDLGITAVSVLQNTRGSTLGRERAHYSENNYFNYL